MVCRRICPLWVGLFSLLGAACLEDAEDAADPNEGTVNGLPAKDFYQPFFYDLYTLEQVLELNVADALVSDDRAPILDDSRSPGLTLFVLPDESYYLEYVEARRGGYEEQTLLFSTMLTGDWVLTDGRIDLGGAATLQLSAAAGNLEVIFQSDLLSSGLSGSPIALDTRSFAGSDSPLDPLLRKHGFKPPLPPTPRDR